MEEETRNWCEETITMLEEEIKKINDEGINSDNITYLGKVIDAHKDLKNEDYWKEKIAMYRDDYDMYGARRRDSRGRYMDDGSYGRRGRRYRGHDMLDNIHDAYSDYMDHAEYGNYGTSESMMKIEVMADSLMDFIHHLKKEAKTPEERELIERKLHEVGRM